MRQATLRALSMTMLAAVAAGCRSSEAPAPAPAAAGGLRLLVSNETSGTIDIVDPAAGTLETRVAVGKRPRGL